MKSIPRQTLLAMLIFLPGCLLDTDDNREGRPIFAAPSSDMAVGAGDMGASDMLSGDGTDAPDLTETPDLVDTPDHSETPDLPPADPCVEDALDCGENGSCVVSDGQAVCVCEEGYDGADCATCAAGYQDNDGDGVCAADCGLVDLGCEHGACADDSGEPVCACDEGYEGARCGVCAPGYQDNNGDGACLLECATAGLECGNGGCSDASGESTCVCDTGYTGASCDTCDTGYQDNDGDGSCNPACGLGSIDCGMSGTCDDSSGMAACECDDGVAGDTCGECAAGYQDNNGDGTCLPDCAMAGLDCGQGECSDTSGMAACVCDQGYRGAACDACDVSYQDEDGDGVCLPDCASANLACVEGACSIVAGVAECLCDQGYAGDLCDTCATDYQDNDADGVCTPSCSTAQATCPANSTCDDSTGTAECLCEQGHEGPGCAYCSAGYQDNNGNGTCEPTCATAGLNCSSGTICLDVSDTPACVPYPQTCSDISVLGGIDGLHRLYVGRDPNKPWDAFCTDMASGSPKAYLPLRKTSGDSNRFQHYNQNGLLAETNFWMVRIDPITLRINVQDFTGSRTVYYQNMSTERVPFASVRSCSNGNPGTAATELVARGKADFSNTPFKLNPVNLVPNRRCGFPTYDVNDDYAAISVYSQSATVGSCAGVALGPFQQHYGLTNCGGAMTVTPDPTVPIDWIGQLYYRGTSSHVSSFPANCLEYQLLNPGIGEGDYTLYLDGNPNKPWTATCLGLGASISTYGQYIVDPDVRYNGPREYVTLTNPDPDSNVMKDGGNYTYNSTRETTYSKLRFDPRTFDVNIQDTTFVSAYVRHDPSIDPNSPPNSYGAVGSCSDNCCGGNFPGTAKLDLRGTPLAFNDTFAASGFCSSGSSTFGNNNQTVLLDGDGQCGGIVPARIDSGDGCFGRPDPYYSEDDFVLQLAPFP